MLNLKELANDEDGIKAVYTVSHTSSEHRTVLEQDLHLTIDPRTGAVSGRLVMEGLESESFEAAADRLATWCERMAAALREPRRVVASVPVFEKDWTRA